MMPKTYAYNSSKGFTLVELLVVVGIVGALVGVSLGTINLKRQQEYAQDASLRSNVEKACAGIRAYYEAENETYPDAGDYANPLDSSASDYEIAAFYIRTWPEGLLYSLDDTDVENQNFSVYAQRATNSNYFVCGSNWPIVRECADGTDVNDPTACAQIDQDTIQYSEPGEYIAPPEPEEPGEPEDPEVPEEPGEPEEICNNNGTCDTADGEDFNNCPADCFCGNSVCEPSKGENYSTCPADCHCGNGVCEVDKGENCATCDSDCYGSACCSDNFCQPEIDCLCTNGRGDCTYSECLWTHPGCTSHVNCKNKYCTSPAKAYCVNNECVCLKSVPQ